MIGAMMSLADGKGPAQVGTSRLWLAQAGQGGGKGGKGRPEVGVIGAEPAFTGREGSLQVIPGVLGLPP
jgi:hypothetical protein